MARRRPTSEIEAPHGDKPLAWLAGEIKTPPLSTEARLEAGVLLRRLQRGESLSMPESRPMPSIGPRCHELRIDDVEHKREWRVMYYVGRCGFRTMSITDSGTSRSPIPDEADHRFRSKPIAERIAR
jgi:hypothetical protein